MFDIWRSGFIRRPLPSVIDRPPAADEVTWLPDCGPYAYVADPFGVTRDGVLTVFVEAFDYHVRRGEIHYRQYDADDRLIGQGVAAGRALAPVLSDPDRGRRRTVYAARRLQERRADPLSLRALPGSMGAGGASGRHGRHRRDGRASRRPVVDVPRPGGAGRPGDARDASGLERDPDGTVDGPCRQSGDERLRRFAPRRHGLRSRRRPASAGSGLPGDLWGGGQSAADRDADAGRLFGGGGQTVRAGRSAGRVRRRIPHLVRPWRRDLHRREEHPPLGRRAVAEGGVQGAASAGAERARGRRATGPAVHPKLFSTSAVCKEG